MKTPTNEEQDVTVAIIDDDVNVCWSMSWLLDNARRIRCLGAFRSIAEATLGIARQNPDVLLLDVDLSGESGIEAIVPMRSIFPDSRIIMHSNYDNEDYIDSARANGASGYLLKNSAFEKICDAILRVNNGESIWPKSGVKPGDDPTLNQSNMPQQHASPAAGAGVQRNFLRWIGVWRARIHRLPLVLRRQKKSTDLDTDR